MPEQCCYRGPVLGPCQRPATQAFDVWSWFQEIRKQVPDHYEVCDRHAPIFCGYTGARSDPRTEKVETRYTPAALTDEEVHALRELAASRGRA